MMKLLYANYWTTNHIWQWHSLVVNLFIVTFIARTIKVSKKTPEFRYVNSNFIPSVLVLFSFQPDLLNIYWIGKLIRLSPSSCTLSDQISWISLIFVACTYLKTGLSNEKNNKSWIAHAKNLISEIHLPCNPKRIKCLSYWSYPTGKYNIV